MKELGDSTIQTFLFNGILAFYTNSEVPEFSGVLIQLNIPNVYTAHVKTRAVYFLKNKLTFKEPGLAVPKLIQQPNTTLLRILLFQINFFIVQP